uniref:KIF-binding protein n=1 Tax=Amphora coffeiformis TaxID=265554 RepID=A0A7S3P6A6_9STRA
MFRRITALNNHGVESMERRHFREAIFSFRHALDCLQSASVANSDANNNNNNNKMQVVEIMQHQPLQVVPIPLDCLDPSVVLSISPHNILEVYQCAFALMPGSPSMQTTTEALMVVFYNLGLTHHLWGLSYLSAKDSQIHLREALRCYKVAGNLFHACQVNGEHYNSGDVPLISSLTLVLGLLNNLGHTLAHFCKFNEARMCGTVLDDLIDSTCSSAGHYLLSEADGDFFFHTLSFMQVPANNLAPAA